MSPPKKYGAEEWVQLEFTKDSFAIFDHSKVGAGFEAEEYLGTERVVKDKEASKRVRLHEEQHQFNKLFEPRRLTFFDSPYSEFKRLGPYAQEHPDQNVTSLVARTFARFFRQKYIDKQARDEIIAYTRDGHTPEDTLQILSKNTLYKFKDQIITDSKGNKINREKYFKEEVLNLTRQLLTTGSAAIDVNQEGHFVELSVRKSWTPEDAVLAQAEVDKVLEEDYQKKLERWIRLITNLHDAGYETRQIVPFLNMLPINRWHSSVRRLLKSKGLRPVDKSALRKLEAEYPPEEEDVFASYV